MNKRKRVEKYIKKLKNDKLEFDKLFRAFFGYLKYVAYDNLIDKSYAEDFAIEALMRIYNNADKCDETRNVYAWMIQITKNIARDYNRKNEKYVCYVGIDKEIASTQNVEEEQVVQYDLAEVLKNLDDIDRKIIVKRAIYDDTFAVIAEELDMPITTVQARYYSALKRLSDKLKNYK